MNLKHFIMREPEPGDELPRDNQGEKQLHRCRHCEKEIVVNWSRSVVHFFTGYQECYAGREDTPFAEPMKGVKMKRSLDGVKARRTF